MPFKLENLLSGQSAEVMWVKGSGDEKRQGAARNCLQWQGGLAALTAPRLYLDLKLEQVARDNPDIKGIMLEGHGIFTWGAGSKECYENTLDIICSGQLIPDIKLDGFSAFAGGTARTPMR